MFYTVSELAKISGVTIRTLHYYDEIGLLKPGYVNEAGYRFYTQKQLMLLQQILCYKELNFDLKQIKSILYDPTFDLLASLKNQKELLESHLSQTKELIRMIQKTITAVEKETILNEQELFGGFNKEKQQAYEQEMIARYGSAVEEHINSSYRSMKHWTKSDWDDVKNKADHIHKQLVSLLENKVSPADQAAQEIIHNHYQWISRFWRPNASTYTGLADLYCTHPDFKKLYDKYHPHLAEYLALAMKHYARVTLSPQE